MSAHLGRRLVINNIYGVFKLQSICIVNICLSFHIFWKISPLQSMLLYGPIEPGGLHLSQTMDPIEPGVFNCLWLNLHFIRIFHSKYKIKLPFLFYFENVVSFWFFSRGSSFQKSGQPSYPMYNVESAYHNDCSLYNLRLCIS